MKAKVNDKIRIVNKMNDWFMDYKEGDIFTVESTWYGGVNVKSASGIPLSLDEVEYEILQEESPSDTGKKINVLFHADSERGIEKALQSAAGFLQYERGEKIRWNWRFWQREKLFPVFRRLLPIKNFSVNYKKRA